MPKAAMHALVWSEDMGVYELRHQGHQDANSLRVEEADTLSLVLDATSFAFQGKRGHLTLRKESRQHGEGYWYAYRNQGRKTIKRYVGRDIDLTVGRLEEIAGTLTEELAELPQAQMKNTEERLNMKMQSRPSLYVVPTREEANVVSQGNVARKLAVPAVGPPNEQPPLLLTPKLLPPRLHPTLIQRPPWLLDRLERGLSGKLTLLSAPAGSGKTTLVSQWLLEHHPNLKRAVAWVSLDAADNDVLRFWHYVLTACQTLQPGLGQSALALLRRAQQSPREHPPLDDALIIFLNELSQMPNKGILVLEDYHLITTPQIHESLAFVLEHLPASLHLLVVTRADPPLPLTRLRAHNELNELRAADLRFSQEETQLFLQQTIPFDLSEEVVRRLDRHMEGWATGLRLVALALQRRTSQQESEQFLLTLSGQQKHLLEFFVTEVLDVQPLPVQIFLLQTSILDRFTGSLCDEVMGRKESERLLATMEQANLFLQPLEGSERWYRYHPLFAEAMRHEARRRLGEEAMRASYDKASHWYEQRSLFTEAISAALSARSFERAAALMERLVRPHYVYEMHEHRTMRRWLTSLPEEIFAQHPKLCMRFAMQLLFSADRHKPTTPARMVRLLQMAEHYWQERENKSELGRVYAAHAVVVGELGDIAQAAHLSRQALVWLPADDGQWRGASFRFMGTEELLAGKLHTARKLFLDAVACYKAAKNGFAARAASITLGKIYQFQGELRLAAELYREVQETAEGDISDKKHALLGLAQLSYEWNALEKAEQEVQQALATGSQSREATLRASLVLTSIQHARGESEQAMQKLRMLLARVQPKESQLLYRELLAQQARLSLARGDLATAERWSTTRTMQAEDLPRLQQEQEEVIVARLLIAQGKFDEALHLLTDWQAEAHEHGRVRSELEIVLLMALAYNAKARQSQAMQKLQEALLLAHAEGYLRLFLDEGETMESLLRAVLSTAEKNLPAPYVRTLLLAFAQERLGDVVPSVVVAPIEAMLIDPLSPQEQRVLRMLVAGYTNPEIAKALVVSINTVKTQVQSVFRKLNVRSRQEAREIVRKQQLL